MMVAVTVALTVVSTVGTRDTNKVALMAAKRAEQKVG